MRIAFVIDSLTKGGAQTFLSLLVEGFAKRGHTAAVFCLNPVLDKSIVDKLKSAGAEVVASRSGIVGIAAGIIALPFRMRRRGPFDLAFTMLPFADPIGRFSAWMIGIRHRVSSVRGVYDTKTWLHRIADRLTARLAEKVIFNSRSGIAYSMEHEFVKESQTATIPNGVIPGIGTEKRSEFLHELSWPDDSQILLGVGRFSEEKKRPSFNECVCKLRPEKQSPETGSSGRWPNAG